MVAVIASLLVIVAEPNVGATPIAPVPNTEISLAVAADGTASFSDPAFAAGDVGDHTPGYDAGANNGIVRTFDTVTYRVDWNANERAADDVELSMTLPAGVRWKRDTTGMVAPGCLDDAAGSSISADGRTWTCALGSKAQGTAGAIFPVAEVEQLLDGNVVAVTATIQSGSGGIATSNEVDTIVSAAPGANWVKHEPIEILDVANGPTLGRLLIFPLVLQAGSLGRKGSEPLDDSYTYSFFDNAWGLANGAVLAPQAMMDQYASGRTRCGGYDGTGAFPYGVATPFAGNLNATSGALAGGTVTCTDGVATDSVVRFEIADQVTSTIPARNADGTKNSEGVSISAQIAWWVPEAELRARAGAPALPTSWVGGLNLGNSISATASPTVYPANPAVSLTPPSVDPILVRGLSGAMAGESSIDDNTVTLPAGASQSSGAGWILRNFTRFDPGPYRQARFLNNGTTVAEAETAWDVIDLRYPSRGGMGTGLSPNNAADASTYTSGQWDGANQVARDQVVSISTAVLGDSSGADATDQYLHSCTAIDTRHLQLVPFPSEFQIANVVNVPVGSERWGRAASTASVGMSNSGPLAHGMAGRARQPHFDGIADSGQGGGIFGIEQNTPFVIEFAHTSAAYRATTSPQLGDPNSVDPAAASIPVGTVEANVSTGGVTCNNGDADARGWVASTDDLSAFDLGGDGRFEDINLVRMRSLQPVKFDRYGGMVVYLQARVGSDLAANPNGTEMYIHSSRAFGAWNPAIDDRPSHMGTTCRSPQINASTDPIDAPPNYAVTTSGWCGRPYNEANEPSTAPGGVGLDPNAVEVRLAAGGGACSINTPTAAPPCLSGWGETPR